MTASLARPAASVAALLFAVAALFATSAATASADDSRWAPADEATITPGVQTYTDGSGQCTANFIFTSGDAVLIGQSAHCAGTGGATATNGCEAGSQPLGTTVEIEGADHPGELVYSSWLAMQERNESDTNTCQYNDFALVEIDPRDHDKVNPSVPFHGGPQSVNTTGTTTGEPVYTYGNSSLRLGIELLKPKQGTSLGSQADGWNHPVYTVTPGIPGDSGSAFLDSQGRAMGTLSTLAIAPLAGSNGVTDIHRAVEYARSSGFDCQLEEGTEPFDPIL
jgi:hypothetical protein